MRRALAPLLAVILLVLMAVPTLAGGKPDFAKNEPLPPEFYPAGAVCDFDLRIDWVVDTGHSITFPPAADGTIRQIVAGHLVAMHQRGDRPVGDVQHLRPGKVPI